jgi:hypothetical protein
MPSLVWVLRRKRAVPKYAAFIARYKRGGVRGWA